MRAATIGGGGDHVHEAAIYGVAVVDGVVKARLGERNGVIEDNVVLKAAVEDGLRGGRQGAGTERQQGKCGEKFFHGVFCDAPRCEGSALGRHPPG